MKPIISCSEAASKIKAGSSIMIGGFLAVGSPHGIIDALIATGTDDLTVIANDTGFPDRGIGRLIVNRQVAKAVASHIGTNPPTGEQMNANELIVDLVPQGTLAEQVRAAGAGLGGVLTPTGLGTVAQEGKEVLTVAGTDYILAMPIKADVALIKAHKADRAGNLVYRRSARNFNPLMAMAADLVLAEVEEIVEVGELDPDLVVTPGIFVDYLVREGE
ncbi:MAG: 3-oxoacid CoA-transferase subunit A [Firmicutes bacterium]|nr:3-oxoacid CoA-transferase subunit A [Bacillota bacterium]